jgi:LmbE family N-acetylglucosaminyl deacetylase
LKITKFLIFLTTILATKLIMKNHIFLFSHQDDEIAIFKTIKDSINTNKNVLIIYLTNGNISKSDNTNFILKRENESKRVLEKLGVSSHNILFMGKKLNIKSYDLLNHLEKAYEELANTINDIDGETSIYTHAWEGGNVDHDSSYVLALKLMKNNPNITNGFQFPFYNSYKIPFNFYRVFCPIKENGQSINTNISNKEKIQFIKFLFNYASQLKIWIGLYPFIIFKILMNNYNYLQKIDKNTQLQKPHKNSLWYEKQNFIKFDKIIVLFDSFLG